MSHSPAPSDTPSALKVLFVVPDLRVGGAERHVTTLLPKMDPARFQPSLVCIGEEGGLFDSLTAAAVPARALNLGGKKNVARALVELVSIMRSLRPHAVVLRGYNAEILGRIAAMITGVRNRIVWVHGFDVEHEQRSVVRLLAERCLVRSTSRYFGVSTAQRGYLTEGLRFPDGKVRIIHNGVELGLFATEDDRSVLSEFGIGEGAPVVGIVAALRPAKDHANLFRAVKLLLADCPEVEVLVVGDGSVRADLEALCTELGIAQNVHFAGVRDDIPYLMQAIDVFTLSSAKETFPIAVLEAMAAARPVVCTDVGGVSEIVEDGVTGFLVPPGDSRQLAARINDVLACPEAARRMGMAGRRRVEAEFSLSRSVHAAEREIEDVVGGWG